MCLTNAEVKEVTEDIVCYKVYISFENKWVSPYMRSPIPNMNEVTKTYLGKLYSSNNCVDKGFHSFATLEDAMNEAKYLSRGDNCNSVIVRCIIPKNSKCYIGSFSGKTSYCSEYIKLTEIIPD